MWTSQWAYVVKGLFLLSNQGCNTVAWTRSSLSMATENTGLCALLCAETESQLDNSQT